MKIITFKSCYYVFEIPDFQKKKKEILSFVTKDLEEVRLNKSKHKTDYFKKSNYSGKILNIISEQLDEFTKYKSEEINDTLRIKTKNFWCQQYDKGHGHPWHIHEESDFFSVLYIDLPNQNTTEILDGDGNSVKVQAKEGDLVIIPSSVVHRSKKSIHKEKKTILSFNFDLVTNINK